MKTMECNHLKIAWRNLLKYKIQSFISIIGIAIGITCFAMCHSMLRNQWSWNEGLPHYEQNYILTYTQKDGKYEDWVNARHAAQIGEQLQVFSHTTVFYNVGGYTSKICEINAGKEDAYFDQINCIYADSSFIRFFDVRLLQGNWEKIKQQPEAFVLTRSIAKKIYGTTDVVGKNYTDIDDFRGTTKSYTIAGVIDDFPINTILEQIGALLLNPSLQELQAKHMNTMAQAFYRLHRPVDEKKLNGQINALIRRLSDSETKNTGEYCLMPYKHYTERIIKSHGWSQEIFFSLIGSLVLLAALLNYILFMSGRILNRQKEYGIRWVVGAGQANIFKMLVAEIFLTLCLALTVSYVLTELFIVRLSQFSLWDAGRSDIQLYIQLPEYTFYLGIIMVFIGWLMIRRMHCIPMLQNLQNGRIFQKTRLQNVLLSFQLIICMLLIGGAFFLRAQQSYLQNKIAGKLTEQERENIYTFCLNGRKLQPIRPDFENMLISNPYVADWCRCGMTLLSPWQITPQRYEVEGLKEEEKIPFNYMYVDPNYLEFIGASMKKGHFYTAEEPFAAVVNQEMARRLGTDPIGKTITVLEDKSQVYRIVGVIEDLLPLEVNPQIKPCFYLPYPQGHINLFCYVKLKPDAPEYVLQALKKKLSDQLSSSSLLRIVNMNQDIAFYMDAMKKTGALLFCFSMVCIAICLLGIYSSMMLAVERKSREMAIRKINGAMMTDVTRIFCKYYFWLLSVSAFIALPLLYVCVCLWLEYYATRIVLTPMPFLCIYGMMGAVILLTILSQLLKVAHINPVKILKSE